MCKVRRWFGLHCSSFMMFEHLLDIALGWHVFPPNNSYHSILLSHSYLLLPTFRETEKPCNTRPSVGGENSAPLYAPSMLDITATLSRARFLPSTVWQEDDDELRPWYFPLQGLVWGSGGTSWRECHANIQTTPRALLSTSNLTPLFYLHL